MNTISPGRFLASSTRSFTLFHGASARTTSIDGSALMRALSKKASDRFASLNEFKEALGAPPNRTEAVSIVHKVTRLASAATTRWLWVMAPSCSAFWMLATIDEVKLVSPASDVQKSGTVPVQPSHLATKGE